MKVLVLEEQAGASCEAALHLADAGHEIVRCHGADEAAFPCHGMTEDHCPLDDGDVMVALMVQAPDGAVIAGDAAEDGARCALRRHIPLVVAGRPDYSPLETWASAVVADGASVTSVVEEVGQQPSPRHGDVAEGAFAGVLEAHGLDPAIAAAAVVRQGADLHVELHPNAPVDRQILEIASVRVAGALRRFDPFPRVIDVVIAPTHLSD